MSGHPGLSGIPVVMEINITACREAGKGKTHAHCQYHIHYSGACLRYISPPGYSGGEIVKHQWLIPPHIII